MKQSKLQNKFHLFKDMSFLHRMLLIFLIGGVIPLVAVGIYTNMQTRKMMISVTEETQTEELSVLGSSLRESMSVLDDAARLLSDNEKIQKIMTKQYKNNRQFYRDYRAADTVIADYLHYYEQDISYINIYVDNDFIDSYALGEVDHFSALNDSVRKQEWYKKTVQQNEGGYWYFGESPQMDGQTIQISRTISDTNGIVRGVVVVLMQYDKTKTALKERNYDTAIIYNDFYWVSGNFSSVTYPFLMEKLQKSEGTKETRKITYGVEEYLLVYERLRMNDSADSYALISIQNYQDIMTEVNRISVQAFIPEIIGVLVSVFLILAFTISYNNRMRQLRMQMHRVAQGEYEKVEPIEGNDEIGQLYAELEQMMKDIQLLMNDVVDEQVQKEKLHTKQKEVEFKMLASQINPHFLYNTLETIRMKAVVNHQPEIVELVKMLAKTMRYNIQVTDRLVRLKEEVQMVEYYLKIQEYRFGDRITSEVTVDSNVDPDAYMMPLTIQPFVENAFVHGLEGRERGGKLEIHVGMQEGDIQIEIWDNGIGMDYFELGKLRKMLKEEDGDQNHIGVRNVSQRIRLLYGAPYGVQIDSRKNQGTRVVICIPYQTEQLQNV